MRFALLTGDETPDDLRELIANLRERQRRCLISSTRDALNVDINEAFDLLDAATPLPDRSGDTSSSPA